MKGRNWRGLFLAMALAGPAAWGAQVVAGLAAVSPAAAGLGAAGGEASPQNAFVLGAKAMNENRWESAAQLFAMAAAEGGPTADGALYWEAYAENKLGHRDRALAVCAALRHAYPASTWLDECGALLIEIKSKSGQPVALEPGQSDEVKLLALNALLKQNEDNGLAAAANILNSDAPEKLKQGVVFLLNTYHDNVTYPQIVRLRSVEGDVRIARGNADPKTGVGDWEQASGNLPLSTGFSLVTGKGGRAEIEFENASTMYLAENSVLLFNDLETIAGRPRTELALLSGTATLHVKPYIAGEWFQIKTPTDMLVARYGENADFRITSYVDGVALAFFGDGVLRLGLTGREPLHAGTTLFYREGRPVPPEMGFHPADFAAWDKWVEERYTARQAAMAEMQQAAGLSEPVPGLDELKGHGRFVDCAPYGRCWEPDETVAAQTAQTTVPSTGQTQTQTAGAAGTAPRPQFTSAYDNVAMQGFPCIPDPVRYRMMHDPISGKPQVEDTLPGYGGLSVLCHAGSWVPRGNKYAWVAGHRRHHRPPCHWARSGRTPVLIPLHPHDVKGQPPLNGTHEGFVVDPREPGRITPIHLAGGKPVRLLPEPPREFRIAYLAPLKPAGTPQMEAHLMTDAAGQKPEAVVPLSFDRKSQSFLVAHTPAPGGHGEHGMTPLNNRQGNLQVRAVYGLGSSGGGLGAGGGFHGGPAFGGSSGTVSSGQGSSTITSSTATTTTTTTTSSPSPGTMSSGATSAGTAPHH